MRQHPYFSASSAIRVSSFLALLAAGGAAAVACGGSDGAATDGTTPDGAAGSDATGPGTGDGGTTTPPDGNDTTDAPLPPADSPNGDGASTGCPRTAAAADRPRRVVVSHPFGPQDDAGSKAKLFEVLELSQAGKLTRPSPAITFSMGTALTEPVVFTPDGEIGLVSQDDGSIGVVKVPPTGAPIVIHAAYAGKFYAGGLILAPDGSSVYVLDSNVRVNGGGVYQIPIHCDGTLGAAELIVPGAGASAMALVPTDPTKAVLAATAAFGSAAGKDVHLIDLAAKKLLGSSTAFADGNAIVAALDVTPDGKFALLADNGFSAGSRLAQVAVSATTVTAVGSLLSTPFPDGVAISPYDNVGIVLNDDSTDQIHVLSYTPGNAGAPFAITGELAYKFGKPQIPTTISKITRGALEGTTFVGENVAVRQLTFEAAGTVTDTAKLVFPGGGNETIVGVVGVQP